MKCLLMLYIFIRVMLSARKATGACPLKDRVLKSSGKQSLPHHVPLVPSHTCEKYKTWDEQQFAGAVSAIQDRGFTVRRAAEEYGIPKSTLHDRLSGKHLPGFRSGPERYLTDEEESELEEFLIGCASVGFAKSRIQVMELVQEVMRHKGRNVSVSHGWWESFSKRHPNITLRTASPLSYARIVGSNPNIIGRYFDLLECTLQENELHDKPSQIFNLDETGMPLQPTPPRVVAERGMKNPSAPVSGDRSQITVLACCSASGYVLPPFVIFDRLNLRPELTDGEVPGTIYGLSRKGWIDGELFELWFCRHFLSYAPQVRPLLLLMDGHSSHYQPAVITRAAEEGVILFTLPPHTSHLTQPLDKGCFGPLKKHWQQECWQYTTKNPGKVVSRYQFSKLFRAAWEKGMTMNNIISGFRYTGIFPFSRSAVLKGSSCVVDEKGKQLSLPERTGLQYIPFYSPLKPTHTTPISARPIVFDADEMELYQKRFEEGYDLPDKRYQRWVKMYHPKHHYSESSPTQLNSPTEVQRCSPMTLRLSAEPEFSSCHSDTSVDPVHSSTPLCGNKTLPRSSFLSKLLADKMPSITYPPKRPMGESRVLTSAENLSNIREKERKKKEESELKERKRIERAQKKIAVEREKERKKLERQLKHLPPVRCKYYIVTLSSFNIYMHTSATKVSRLHISHQAHNKALPSRANIRGKTSCFLVCSSMN